MNWAEHSEEIEAPIETCFMAIVDYESFPGWQGAVDSVEVLDRTPDGLGHRVHLFVDAKVRKIDYVLAYRYQRPTEAGWDFVEGNGMNAMEGAYTFEELGPERTRATYSLGADPAIPVPGMIMRRTHRQLVKASVEDLKREAERRHAAGEDAAPTAVPDDEASAEGGSEVEELDIGQPEAAPGTPGREAEESPDDWRPKAAREADAPSAADSAGPPRTAPHESLSELPAQLLGKAASTCRGVADGALRAGLGAAEQAVEITRDVAGGLLKRVNRILGDGEDGDRRS